MTNAKRAPSSPARRVSTCELEIDVDAADVLNANDKVATQAAFDSQAALVPQLALLWEVSLLRKIALILGKRTLLTN